MVEGLKMGDNNGKPDMKKITLSIPDDLEKELRQYAEVHHGGMKGALSLTVMTALREYFAKHDK